LNFTRPFASLTADHNGIVIEFPYNRYFLSPVRIDRKHIVLIEPYEGWISRGVRFWSNQDDRDVIFWTEDPEFVIDSLRILGWDATG
jgi:hypothetical protein